jgi:hypothetical protein
MYSHSGQAFGVAKIATTFLVILVTSCMQRLIFEICFERRRLDENCDEVNHKSKKSFGIISC